MPAAPPHPAPNCAAPVPAAGLAALLREMQAGITAEADAHLLTAHLLTAHLLTATLHACIARLLQCLLSLLGQFAAGQAITTPSHSAPRQGGAAPSIAGFSAMPRSRTARPGRRRPRATMRRALTATVAHPATRAAPVEARAVPSPPAATYQLATATTRAAAARAPPARSSA